MDSFVVDSFVPDKVRDSFIPDSPMPRQSFFANLINSGIDVAKDILAQIEDLMNIPAVLLGIPRPPMKSKLSTESVPYLMEKATTPIGNIDIPTMTYEDLKSTLRGDFKYTVGNIEPTLLDIMIYGLMGASIARNQLALARWNHQLNKLIQTEEVRGVVMNNMEAFEGLMGQIGVKTEGMDLEAKTNFILSQAKDSPKLGSAIMDLVKGKIIAKPITPTSTPVEPTTTPVKAETYITPEIPKVAPKGLIEGKVEVPSIALKVPEVKPEVIGWAYGAEPYAAIPGEPIAFYGLKEGEDFNTAKAQIIYDEKDNQPLGYKIVLANGQILANPKSDKIGGSPYFETLEEAQKYTELKLSIPTGQKPLAELPKEQVAEVPSGGETKVRGLAKGVEEKAIENKLTQSFGDLPEYQTVNMKEQASKAQDLLTKDPEKARRIAMGEELAPQDILPESLFVAVENKAVKEGDVATLKDLAQSSGLTTEATTMGQRIRTLAERDPESPVTAINEVVKAREQMAQRRLGKETKKLHKTEVASIKEHIKRVAPTKETWADFIRSIQC